MRSAQFPHSDPPSFSPPINALVPSESIIRHLPSPNIRRLLTIAYLILIYLHPNIPACYQFSSSQSIAISLHACQRASHWKSFYFSNTVRFRIMRELKIRESESFFPEEDTPFICYRVHFSFRRNFEFPSLDNILPIFLPGIFFVFQRIYQNQGNKGSLIDQGY